MVEVCGTLTPRRLPNGQPSVPMTDALAILDSSHCRDNSRIVGKPEVIA